MLTDTLFWVDLLKEQRDQQKGPASRFLAQHRHSSLRISIITWQELAAGFHSPGALGDLLRKIHVLSLHRQVAWQAARIERKLALRRARLSESDIGIAATAMVWGLKLVTRDPAFECVHGLKVVQY